MNRLAGKVCLITGTGSGQGRAAALRFAAEGAVVVGCDLDAAGAAGTVALVEAAGGSMDSTHPLDLGDEDAVAAWVDGAVRRHGGIVNCAVFLASDEASYVTGANLMVDGGWSAVLPGPVTA